MKLLVMQFSPAFLTYPHIPFSSCCVLNLRNLVSLLYKTRQNYIFVHRNLYIFRWQMERRKMNRKEQQCLHLICLIFYMYAILILSVSPPHLLLNVHHLTVSPHLLLNVPLPQCLPHLLLNVHHLSQYVSVAGQRHEKESTSSDVAREAIR